MSPRRVVQILRWFELDGAALVGEEVLARVPPLLLREVCERPPDDLLLGTYPVGDAQAQVLAPWISHVFDRDRFSYVIEPAQVSD